MKGRSGISFILMVLLPVFVLAVCSSDAYAQSGKISGKVIVAETGIPLPYANVILVGTTMGGMTLTDGTFLIAGVPPGTYTVKVMMMGYKIEEKAGVRVDPSQTSRVEFQLTEQIVGETQEILVEAEQKLVQVKDSDVKHTVTSDELKDLPVDDVVEALALKGGIVKTGDDLHVRGGRSGEVQFQIDGVPVDDPLGGGMISVGLLGTADSEVITGGMDAEYGNAQSAIVKLSTREGGKTYEGQIRYMTDDFGRKDKTYTNYDRLSVGFGGPMPMLNGLTFYLSGEVSFTDGENWMINEREEHTFLNDFFKFSDRASHNYNFQGKLAYSIKPGLKVLGEAIYGHAVNRNYAHNWNLEGYVQKIYRFMTLRLSRDSFAEDSRAFGQYVSFYHGDWIDKELPRVSYYPSSLEARRKVIYPIVVFSKVRDPDNPEAGAFVIRYDQFYARLATNIYQQEVEIIWDEAIINEAGVVESYESKLLFEGFQNPDSEFSHFRDDSSYVYFNSANNITTNESDNLQLKFALNHNISEDVLYTINLSRIEFKSLTAVNGKNPEDYNTAGLPVILPSGSYQFTGVSNITYYTDPEYPYYLTSYDMPFYGDRTSITYILKTDITSQQWKNHMFKTGLQFVYNDLNNETINFPGNLRRDEDGVTFTQGTSDNIFHNYNPEASFFVQDKWEYEGMVVNGGVRVDYFSPGNNNTIEITSSEIDPNVEEHKFQLSPRLGFAFPITDKDKFYFHYGRFTQWPARTFLFQSQELIGGAGILGNPDLDEELTISYQAGISHQFSENVAGNFVVFNKDIYGLISSTRVTDEDLGVTGFRYINRTYASSRGVELALSKRLTHYIGGDISYTLSYADGVASNANFGISAEGLTHLPTQEMPLNWDQRHTLNVTVRLQDRNNWGATIVYSYGSGLPWTPFDRYARRQDPMDENSRRLESTHTINLQGRKKFNIYGQELTLFFEGRNLLDEDILQLGGTSPGVFPNMANATMDGGSYLTETGLYGGAYLQDLDEDGIDDFTPVNDPTIWASHRQWRIGFGFEF
ncbi:MAG: carboxypeptidase-like regulatory domain-containing protein [Candidatus Krumholzibacteriota bacterium]|nr:carboxypeptidase-like regulatory domain-containing protein [Candidatus Krumholzibacteriota bacterium]